MLRSLCRQEQVGTRVAKEPDRVVDSQAGKIGPLRQPAPMFLPVLPVGVTLLQVETKRRIR